jgi:hypothetical protein
LRVEAVRNEKVVAEAGGNFAISDEEERPPLETDTKQWEVNNKKTMCVL